MKRVKRIIRPLFVRALRASGLYVYWRLSQEGPLKDDGWFRSFAAGMPVDAAGNPLPWLPYPVTELLERRVSREMTVFEYGCGNSTLWWARRVRRVVACEDDPGWHARVREAAPANVKIILQRERKQYERAAADEGERFDIVVIDGSSRVRCAASAVQALKPGGVIVWDDSEREKYRPGFAFLESCGFRRLPLAGLAPPYAKKTETSIFYRDDNCLGI